MAAALAERRFLAEVEHPNIVKIHNFVEHHGDGYIVMEYVDGVSLKRHARERRDANGGRPDPLPGRAGHRFLPRVLPALAHLHELGLVFCDFKPDNVIQPRGAVKLIDLGGVYRLDDEASPVYGTVGYQAPEVAETGPTIPVRSLHRRPHARRADHGLQRLPEHVPLHAATSRTRPPVLPLPIALRVARTGDGGGSRRAVPERRGDGRPAARCVAGDRGRRRPHTPGGREHPLHATGAWFAHRARLANAADTAGQSGRSRRPR